MKEPWYSCSGNSIRVGDDSPVAASFDVDGQGRTRWFFQNVRLRRIDKTRVPSTGVYRDVYLVRPDPFPRPLRWSDPI